MSLVKLIVTFSVLAVSVVLCLWAGDLIGGELAASSMKKSLMIVGIVGICATVIYGVLSGRKSSPPKDRAPNSGPQF